MGFFDNIGKGISDFSQSTIQKGKDAANIAKLNRMVSDEEKVIQKLYEALGKQYFMMHPEDYDESFGEIVQGISQSMEKVTEYTNQIKELQGIVRCTQCGTDVPNDAVFCPECGTRIIRKDEPKDEEGKPVEKIFCTNCGTLTVPGSKFCINCGAKIEQPSFVQPDGASDTIIPDEKADFVEEPDKIPEE